MTIPRIFAPDHRKYEGVRPFHIYLLRIVYFLMAAFVATAAWSTILRHEGPWDPVRAVAWCVWAIYPTMAILGVIYPLRMLPIMIFMIGYKLLWLAVVAYPMWRAGTLAGSPAEEIANSFIGVFIVMLAVPWPYVFRTYVRGARAPVTT
jgi:hypothetical protein